MKFDIVIRHYPKGHVEKASYYSKMLFAETQEKAEIEAIKSFTNALPFRIAGEVIEVDKVNGVKKPNETFEHILPRIHKVWRSHISGNLQCMIGEQKLVVWHDDERYRELYEAVLGWIQEWEATENVLERRTEYRPLVQP